MKYMVRCFHLSNVKYRTTVVVLRFETWVEVWEHVDRCPHGHEVH